jgi:hypothetical protein
MSGVAAASIVRPDLSALAVAQGLKPFARVKIWH